MPLKLAVAAGVIPRDFRAGAAYLDVSVPERPVAGTSTLKSQVEVETLDGTSEVAVDNADKESVPCARERGLQRTLAPLKLQVVRSR